MLRNAKEKTCKGTCQQAFSENSLVIPTAEAVGLSVVPNSSDFENGLNFQSDGQPRARPPRFNCSTADASIHRARETRWRPAVKHRAKTRPPCEYWRLPLSS